MNLWNTVKACKYTYCTLHDLFYYFFVIANAWLARLIFNGNLIKSWSESFSDYCVFVLFFNFFTILTLVSNNRQYEPKKPSFVTKKYFINLLSPPTSITKLGCTTSIISIHFLFKSNPILQVSSNFGQNQNQQWRCLYFKEVETNIAISQGNSLGFFCFY